MTALKTAADSKAEARCRAEGPGATFKPKANLDGRRRVADPYTSLKSTLIFCGCRTLRFWKGAGFDLSLLHRLESALQSHHSKPAPFANPAKSAAPAKTSSTAVATPNHFDVNYLSGIIRIRHDQARKTQCDAKGLATRP
jgi:hypothetical protein